MTTRNFRVNNGLECGDITLSASANTITGLSTSAPSGNGDVVTKAYSDSGTQTMTNKTLTSPTISAPTILGTATVGAITTNVIASNGSNAELSIQPSGTGDLLLSSLRINGTTHSTGDVSTDAGNAPTLATHVHEEIPGTGGSGSPSPATTMTSKPFAGGTTVSYDEEGNRTVT